VFVEGEKVKSVETTVDDWQGVYEVKEHSFQGMLCYFYSPFCVPDSASNLAVTKSVSIRAEISRTAFFSA
jgi:hypothetical protein